MRSWPLEDRIKHAKVPAKFRSHMTAEEPSSKLSTIVDGYERGLLLTMTCKDTYRAAVQAAWVLQQLAERGESVRWIGADDYVVLYKDEWEDDDEGALWRELKYINRGYDVLVIDGLGEEANTEFERKILGSLIKGRSERELTTIITTVYNPVELAAYGRRAARYAQEGETIKLGRQ